MSGGDDHIILSAKGVTKDFPGVRALDDASINAYAGKVNAVMGENGAGKSTFMNILSGVYTDFEGTIILNNTDIQLRNTAHAQDTGISIIHQELNLVQDLTVAENIFLGREPLNRAGLIDYREMQEKTKAILDELKLSVNPRQKIMELRVGQQQMVEIAKAISFQSKVLIMDEPTSALSETETEVLFEIIKKLKGQGVAILYITHKMEEVERVADYITIFRDGRLISEDPLSSISGSEIINRMVGRDPDEFYVKQTHDKGEILLETKSLSLYSRVKRKNIVEEVSFQLMSSEVLGIYGLMGAGRTELLETIYGLHSKQMSGEVWIDGKLVRIRNTVVAINNKLALVPEDRKRDGLVLEMDINDNINLASLSEIENPVGLLSQRKAYSRAEKFRDRLNIKSYSIRQQCVKLSGGNQQKVVLGKCLSTGANIFLFDEPTRGIDINAKNEIYTLIDELADSGKAILIVSSELPEIMAISDRIIVLCEGSLTGEFDRSEFNENEILEAALPGVKIENE